MIKDSLFLLSVSVVIILGLISCGSSQQNEIMLKVNTARPDARINVVADGETAVIDIFSESGIGSAVFEVTSETLPKRIILRFNLRGLEELRFSYDETVITASLSSANAPQIRQSFSRAGETPIKETVIAADSPYWMKMRAVPSDGAPAKIPLQHGYIDVEAPEHFLKGEHRQAAIHWIDFYR